MRILINWQKCCTEYKISGVILIHTYGNPADLDKISNICSDKNIPLIEDTCERIARWNEQHVGTFGFLGTFGTTTHIISVHLKVV